MGRQLRHEEFIARISSINPDIEVLGNYTKAREPILVRCKVCNNTWNPTPDNLYRGRKCPFCSGKRIVVGKNDLASQRPDLAEEWDYSKNEKAPEEYHLHSNKKVYWVGKCGHGWDAIINNRVRENAGCPICAGKIIEKGFNDLESQSPVIAAEWDDDKNDIHPDEVFVRSKKKYWWKCPAGHSYKTYVYTRTIRGSGCPECNSLGTSFPEQAVYYYVKQLFSDAENRYKHNDIEFDIFIPTNNTAIEYDGVFYHADSEERDDRKDKYCRDNKIRLIRIREEGLPNTSYAECIPRGNLDDIYSLAEAIKCVIEKLMPNGIDNVDIQRDQLSIRQQIKRIIKEKSLKTRYPDIAEEWCYEKNGKLLPEMFPPGSAQKVWWRCSKYPDHIWDAQIKNRVIGRGCPYCSNQKILVGFNDLASQNKQLAREWSSKNEKKPFEVFPNTHEVYLWDCPNGHEYPSSVANRSKGKGCPYCSGNKLVSGKDLKSLFPDIAKEWDYDKNINDVPEKNYPYSDKDVYWVCSKGHSFHIQIKKRTARKNGCPYCSGKRAIAGENDLQTLRPNLAEQWNYERNLNLKPTDVKVNSNKKAWWKCSICGKEWEAKISDRSRAKLPYCKECNRRIRRGNEKSV